MKNCLHLIIIALIISPLASRACSCISSTGEQSVLRTSLIAGVEILTADTLRLKSESRSNPIRLVGRYKARVTDRIKGDQLNDTIIVYSDFSSCGYIFEPGSKYLLYANIITDPRLDLPVAVNSYYTSNCTQTSRFSASKQLAVKKILHPGFDIVVPKKLDD